MIDGHDMSCPAGLNLFYAILGLFLPPGILLTIWNLGKLAVELWLGFKYNCFSCYECVYVYE